GLKEKYEVHHGIRIQDNALIAASALSDRYITDRFLPDKAIDLLDEAASSIKIESESKPETLDTLTRKITQLQIEKQALSKEKGPEAKDKVKDIEGTLKNLKEDAQTLEHKWLEQKELMAKMHRLREEMDGLKIKLEDAEREVRLDEAAKLKYGELPQKQKELSELEKKWGEIKPEDRLLKEEVDEEDIAAVVSRWTGIPVQKLVSGEKEKLAHLEADLARRVVGQEAALKAVANAVRRARAGIAEKNRPLAVFLFLGPTGVGKTETAKALAESLFSDEKAIVRLDMSEFSERHTVARLIGAPPGYVGFEVGGELTEKVRRHPYAVVLLDEIEKSHHDIFNLFLQIFDEGRLTDGHGRLTNFKNTIIIMTSNLGGDILQAEQKSSAQKQREIWELVKATFPPEFLNRLDQTIMYEPLTPEQMTAIVDKELAKVQLRLQEQGITLIVSPQAKTYLAKTGSDPAFGARPLKRLIQTSILDDVALKITEGRLKEGVTIRVDLDKTGKTLQVLER
ncbi:MAG: AAA family ATPase, partial [Candidatus Chisholmbacteria bacterium]|nr:AAA family ATPase [Candidatus Chisholmbacteria bacterium]